MAVDANETRRQSILSALADGASRTWTRTVGANTFSFTVANPLIRILNGARVLSAEVIVTRNGVTIFDDIVNMPNPATAVRNAGGSPQGNPLQGIRDTLLDVVRVSTQGFQVALLQRTRNGFIGDTLAVRADAADGSVFSSDAVWTVAQDGSGLTVSTTATTTALRAENAGAVYQLREGFEGFDTSSLGATAIISAGVMTLYGTGTAESNADTTTLEVRDQNWGGTVTTADWTDFNPGTNWTNKTLLANFAVGSWNQTNNTANDLTSQSGMTSWISKTGVSYCALAIDRTAGSAPTGSNILTHYTADVAGTTSDPLLTVTYTLPKAMPIFNSRPWRRWSR